MTAADACDAGDDAGDGDEDAPTRRTVRFLMCFFHMMKGARENRSKLKTKDNYGEILRDLRALHCVPHPCEDAFEYFLSLFYEKWTERGESEFVEYVKKYWGGIYPPLVSCPSSSWICCRQQWPWKSESLAQTSSRLSAKGRPQLH